MVYTKKTTLNLYVNFLLDFIPSNSNSVLEVCDCNNFMVVKGQTSHSELINLNHVNLKFEEKYPNIKSKNTIDLIEYDVKMDTKKKYEFIFHNTPNLSQPYDDNNSMFTLSDFPWGYSWSQGKLLYFYFKHITYKIPNTYPFNWIKYSVSVDENNNIDFEIEDNYINNQNNILKSSILDNFDFNLQNFENETKKMDLEHLILNPSEIENLSKIKVEDFIII